jgi:hypothetical protein
MVLIADAIIAYDVGEAVVVDKGSGQANSDKV